MEITATRETSQAVEVHSLTPQDRLARAGGWWTLALAFIMLGSVAEAVHAAAWSEGLAVVRLAIMGGGLIGYALALTRFSSLFAAGYGIVAGVFWVTVSLHRVLLPDLGTHDAVQELLLRNAGWLLALIKRGAAADNLVFVTQLGLLGWWLGFFATWNLFRHRRVLIAAVPAGIALLINLYYSPINLTGYLFVFLMAILLLAVRIELARNETRWQMSRIRYAPDIYIDFLKAGIAFAAIAVLVSWAMPDVANRTNVERFLRPFERPWKTVEDTWSRMYQSLSYPGIAPQATRYGKNLTLGGPVSLSDRPIFEAQFPMRTYWRAATYDSYDGRGWTNTDQETSIIERGQWLGEPLFAASAEMTATLRPLEPGQDVILAPPQPVRVSLPVDADIHRITDDGTLVNVSRMRSRIELSPGAAYRAVSAVTQAPVSLLRADKAEYPSWVTERYLGLPEGVPTRVLELGRQITAPHNNAYDRAAAIETYLRSYPYSTEIAAPPEGMDAVEYFLFDLKQGYCDYYASAMVVMLRAVGIPSRLAAGYAPGEMLPALDDKPVLSDTYRVEERNAHAWVEAFFPTYGWIQFEPTSSQPLVQRLLVPKASAPDAAQTPAPEDEENLKDLRNTSIPEAPVFSSASPSGLVRWIQSQRIALGIVTVFLVLAVATAIFLRRRQEAFLKGPELLAGLLGRVGTWATRLKIPWPASDTPLEHATHFGRRVPEAEPIVSQMAILFVAQRYGCQRPPSDTVQSIAREWLGLQPSLWKRWARRVVRPTATHPSKTPTPAERGPRHWDPDQDQSPRISRRH
jgi:transglutaminase-like putative cysteine protease